MRTGAIFARGSCRALKWMALVGVVFALGAGQAAAQVKVSVSDKGEASEGGRVTITVSADIRVGTNQPAEQTWTVAAPTVSSDAFPVDHVKRLTPAEAEDYTLPGAVEVTIPGNPSTVTGFDTTVSATFTIQLQSDADAEDEVVDLQIAADAGTLGGASNLTQKGGTATLVPLTDQDRTKRITIRDSDPQDFIWDGPTEMPKEGENIMVTLTAKPPLDDLEYDMAMSVDTKEYTVTPTTFQFDASEDTANVDGPSVTLTIEVPKSDKNRTTDKITVNAITAGTVESLVPPLPIEVADIHALPMADKISAKAYTDDGKGKPSKTETMSVMEGGDPVHVTVTVDRGTDGYPDEEKLKVSVMADSGQALDYRVDPATFDIDSGTGKKSATFKLWALKDDDVGDEPLTLHLKVMGEKAGNGSGEVTSMFSSLTIEDDTTAKVWAKDSAMDTIYDARNAAAGDDKMINPGENFEIMTDDLFGHLPTVTVAYAASSDNSAVGVSASGEKIMVMPQDMEGKAKITVTATATDKASSFDMQQDRSDVAHIMFEVDVMLAELTYTLMGPEDMNLVEGMSYKIEAMASRAVAEDTMVELVQTDGTASPSDYTVENIAIKAGEKMGYTMLMVNADEMMENDGNMAEMLTLEGRVGAMKTNALSFNLWDAAVPALPVIAQFLLAALLGLGGYRRYLRR